MSDISKINPNGTEFDLKDATARAGIESSKTLKSSVVTVNDAAPINAEDITVDIEPIQDLHGYDRPWAGGAGENIFTSVSWEQGAISSVAGHTYEQNKVASTTRIRITALFPLTNGETYTINFSATTYEAVIQAYDANGISIAAPIHYNDWLTNYQEFSGVAYIGVALRKKDGTNISISDASDANVRINRGGYSNICPIEGWTGAELTQKDEATNPTVTHTYTASFGETVYGGKWHVTEGGTDNDRVYVVARSNNTDEGYVLSNNIVRLRIPNIGTIKSSADSAICSHLRYVDSWDGGYQHFYCSTASNIFIFVPGSTVQEAKDYLEAQYNAGTPIEICATKNTPTTISTPKQNVSMLQGINTVYADCGDTQLKYQPDNVIGELKGEIRAVEAELAEVEENLEIVYEDHVANTSMGIIVDGYSVGDMPFSNALDIAKTGYTPIAVTDTSVVLSSVADQGEIATHCLLDVTNNRVRFYVHVMDSAASLTIPPNSLTFRVAYKKA